MYDDLLTYATLVTAYKNYIEANLERIERGGWTPVCFAEFLSSAERETYVGTNHAVCVHCDESHQVDDDHQCATHDHEGGE